MHRSSVRRDRATLPAHVTPKQHSDDEIQRAVEIAEEERYARESAQLALLNVPPLNSISRPEVRDVVKGVQAKRIRQWVRDNLTEPTVVRMFHTAHGIQKFDVPTAMGNVVRIEADPAVQVRAMMGIIGIGLPAQLGLVDEDGDALPGVLALGPIDLDEARKEAHGERYVAAAVHARAAALGHTPEHHHGNGNGNGSTGPADAPPLPPMSDRIAHGEFEVVEVSEGVDSVGREDRDEPPGPLPTDLTMEQKVLANRLARKAKKPIPYPDL